MFELPIMRAGTHASLVTLHVGEKISTTIKEAIFKR